MSRYPVFNRARISLRPLAERGHDLTIDRIRPLVPPEETLLGDDFPQLLAAIRTARQNQRPVIAMLGGHPIKLGLSRYLIDLMERDWITHVATNGAGIIHDFELALVGGTIRPTTGSPALKLPAAPPVSIRMQSALNDTRVTRKQAVDDWGVLLEFFDELATFSVVP